MNEGVEPEEEEIPKGIPEEKSRETIEKERERELIEEFFGMPPEAVEKIMKIVVSTLDAIKGVKDVKGRLAPLQNPEGRALETTSNLTSPQTQAIAEIKTIWELFPEIFEALNVHSDHVCLTSISKEGLGREQDVALIGAYSGSQLLKQFGVTASLTPSDYSRKKAEKKGIFK